MRKKLSRYEGIAACHNDRCPSHANCLRWQIGKRNPDIIAGNFAPVKPHSQRCREWRKGRVL